MGVDYSANYGIGVRVLEPENCEDFIEYVDDLSCIKVDGIEMEYFEIGDGSYTGEENDVILCIRDADVTDLADLENKINIFKEFLKSNKVETDGEISLRGGLNIW